jgi:hypothetical protein
LVEPETLNYRLFFGAFHRVVGQDVGQSGNYICYVVLTSNGGVDSGKKSRIKFETSQVRMNYKYICAGQRQEQWRNISFTQVLSGRTPATVFKVAYKWRGRPQGEYMGYQL